MAVWAFGLYGHFLFLPSDHFYTILPSIIRAMFYVHDKLAKKVYRILNHWIYFKTTVSILCPYLYVTPTQTECPSLFINQVLLLNSFFKISIFISCYPRNKVCMILTFTHPLLIFLFWVICFKLGPDTLNFFFPPEGSSYQESMVMVFYSFSNNCLWMTNKTTGADLKDSEKRGGTLTIAIYIDTIFRLMM